MNENGIVLHWTEGERTVRWDHGPDQVVKEHPAAPQSVVAWDGKVLVVEALPEPAAPKSNAVVYAADGTELVRLGAPEPAAGPFLLGFYSAYLDEGGPVVVVTTRAGDWWGRVDLANGTLRDVREWR
ncbi:hypothetical protein SRB5_63850 [Streptomyces sp. RB5]|uniref:Uncharacterized protein n=1 Tax=Streptomyces smaragdinus TaxID=2585196 RepID=A0A7K0CRU9_9ACTN|nr:hypothetical protein [Streptomyces smaragdinus]MQY16189.1 hypothetical protein [Streptomyces smaragdinus]